MACPYCLQTGDEIPANKKVDIGWFVERFAEYFSHSTVDKLIVWGGEPLVYWGRVKELIDTLRARGIEPNKGFYITTNGRKMNEDYVEFVNSRPIWTTISTHGWGFTQNQLDTFFKLKAFSLSEIIHHNNINFLHLRSMFFDLAATYKRAPRIYLHYLRANSGCDSSFYLTKDDVDRLANHLVHEVLPLAIDGDEWARWQLAQLLSERRKETNKGKESKCISPARLSIDLFGNQYECHHNYDASNIIGNIFSKTIPIYAESTRPNPFKFSDSIECRECSVFNECHGGCYLSNTHDVDCYLAKTLSHVYMLVESFTWAHSTATPQLHIQRYI